MKKTPSGAPPGWASWSLAAGPTGVEMAGTLAEIARHTLPGEFRRINPASARVLLLEGGPRVLQAMPAELSARAQQHLERLGVEVLLNTQVTDIDSEGVTARNASAPDAAPHRIAGKTVIWAAGVAASPLGRLLARSVACETDRAGRVPVQADLSLAGHPEISVIGDLALFMQYGPAGPHMVPGVSPAAKQMGFTAATNILRRLQQQTPLAFHYIDYGNLATIGRHSAVVDLSSPLGPLRFWGYPAWLFWLFAHVYFLIGFRNRLVVLLDWAWAYWSFARYARVVSIIQYYFQPGFAGLRNSAVTLPVESMTEERTINARLSEQVRLAGHLVLSEFPELAHFVGI